MQIFADFAPHMERSNADFTPHMEGRHADFSPRMERRHTFTDQNMPKIAISAIFQKELFPTTYILVVYMTYVNTFETINILRESTFNE